MARPYRPTILTPQSLTRTRRWLDRRRHEADEVLAQMRRGATLHVQFGRDGQRWRLSTGERVAADVVELVRADNRVVGAGDCLFGMTSQTFRFGE
jgi:hypothetical protein